MRIAQIISVMTEADGHSVFCGRISGLLARQGHACLICTCPTPGGMEAYHRQEGLHLVRLPPPRLLDAGALRRALEKHVAAFQPDLLHVHGLWHPCVHAAMNVARQRRLPVMLSPHGMLTPWSLQFRRWKKRLAWMLYQRADLRSATAFHVTSTDEADDIRRLGLRQPVSVIPLGVDLPAVRLPEVPADRNRTRTVLFLSRIHPKKGLLGLADAWAQARQPGWRIVIAGPDEGGHRAQVERRFHEAGAGDSVCFAGPAYGEARDALYRAADLFILPSHSENFGLVVPEALACGIPVITTRATPWVELERQGCGWWVDPTVEALTGALRQALALSDAERRTMGERGRDLVAAHYTWEAVAQQVSSNYAAWLHAASSRRPAY